MTDKIITFAEDSFWRGAYPEGATEQDILNELSDFEKLISSAHKVFYEVTGGRISKANTDPDAVLGEFRDFVEEQTDNAIHDHLECRA